jgi:TonB family protein
MRTPCLLLAVALGLSACGDGGADSRNEVPPDLEGDPAVEYPVTLYAAGVSGVVQLRLFVDSTGAVVPDSTLLHQTSGHAAFDSAALAAAADLRYVPGLRRGRAAGMLVLQEIQFRHPGASDSTP